MAKTKLPRNFKSLSENSLMAGLMVILTLTLVASFLISKQLLGDIRFNSRVATRKNVVKQAIDQNVNALPELKSNFDTLKQNGPQPSKVLSALPLDSDYPGLAAQYELMATSVGARLASISIVTAASGVPAASGSAAGLQTVNFKVTAIGSYASQQMLLAEIEKSLRPTKIQSVTFSGVEPTVTADFSLITYYQPAATVEPGKEVIR